MLTQLQCLCHVYLLCVQNIMAQNSQKGDAPKLRIKLRSYDLKMLESAVTKILWLLLKSGATIKWPIPLPKKVKKYSVIKSHFVYKDGVEQFERITYTRLIDVVETGPKTVEYLQNLSIPVGISVEVKVY